ncbi:MAG TPA: PQQ-dependent sugar dehydrogenase [Labilithrix sp.]|nr:PQQ-dependent sugar dehydrogenase [Labilithrix sp.]
MPRSTRSIFSFGIALVVVCSCGDDDAKPAVRQAICTPPSKPAGANVSLVPALGGVAFEAPVELVFGPGGRAYVVEQGGIVKAVPAGGGEATVVLDVSSSIVSGGEAGLLGLAFDPNFAESGFAYVYFTASLEKKDGVAFQDVLARVTSNDGGATFDPASQKILFAIDDPYTNHNGGHVAFGPDGMLYVGLGDGGSGGDPQRYAQNKDVLLGKLLRIDPSGGDPYGVPNANPFVAGGGRPEVYAYGLRNPWKFSFDTLTGDLWLADVGQTKYEEVNRIVPGGNYGWNIREGKHCYAATSCSTEGLIDPIAEYPRSDGISVTGGYVYRGTKVPALEGKFLYGDFGTGKIWSVDALGQSTGTLLLSSNLKISSFGQDPDGEVYVVDYSSGTVKQIVAGGDAAASSGAGARLSETGCLDPAAPARAPNGAIAYTVNSPLWSDGAQKDRWLFVPTDKKIGVRADGDFDVPPESVAVKTFTVSGKKVETRLFVRYDDDTWAGFSYEWNDDQTDALLIEGGKAKDLPGGGAWYFPSRGECFACHTPAAGFTLGLEARQLSRGGAVGAESMLGRFATVLEAPIADAAFPPLRAADTVFASAEERARGYLHSNCSMCHREGGGAGAATLDLRIDRPLALTRTCQVAPQGGDLGVAGAQIVAPGDPAKSTLALRMRAMDQNRMPTLATRVVDEAGAAAIETWIRELTACP